MDKKQSSETLVKISIGLTIFTVVNYWVNGLISTYYYTVNFNFQYSALLIASAIIALIGFVLSTTAMIKVSGHKVILFFCVFVTFIMMALELLSVFFQNSLR